MIETSEKNATFAISYWNWREAQSVCNLHCWTGMFSCSTKFIQPSHSCWRCTCRLSICWLRLQIECWTIFISECTNNHLSNGFTHSHFYSLTLLLSAQIFFALFSIRSTNTHCHEIDVNGSPFFPRLHCLLLFCNVSLNMTFSQRQKNWCWLRFFSSRFVLLQSNSVIPAKHTKFIRNTKWKILLTLWIFELALSFSFPWISVVQHTNRYDMQKTEHFAFRMRCVWI